MTVNRLLCLTIICIVTFVSPLYAKNKILIYTNSYEPYYGENMVDFGPVLKISVLAFKEVGYDVEVKFCPWARCVKEGKEGKCDMIAGVWRLNPERDDWMAYTDAILENEIGFYKRKNDSLVFKSYGDLKEKNIVVGTVRGYVNPKGFVEAGIKTEEVTEDLQNMNKLTMNRIRLALVDRHLGAHLMKKEGREKEIKWLVTLQKIPLRNGIMKNSKGDWQKKRDDFNKGLHILKSKGVVDKILKEHNIRF